MKTTMTEKLPESTISDFSIEVAGENAFIMVFGGDVSPEISTRVQATTLLIRKSLGHALIDIIPSYSSLLVIFDIWKVNYGVVLDCMRHAASQPLEQKVVEGHLVTLPVYYSVESGPDLKSLSEKANLTIEEVIRLHHQQEYRVYAIGFAPGFAYLGEVDKRIAAARLPTPRDRVPKGAVAIADRQTAVYPSMSPGGWNLIGLCPQDMFSPQRETVMPVRVGD
ncbi:MAG: KipI family sensor histidine kinase inhibitor, partial [Oceanicoccus sp.]